MRCEANISVQEKGQWKYENGQILPIGNYKLNPKVELKNINSFKYMEKAVDYEIKRQIKALNDGEKLVQETRGWNNDKGITFSQRVKETSADYRYFPEPDIPPLVISDAWVDEIKARLSELPAQKIERFKKEYLFTDKESEILAGDIDIAGYTEKVISELRAWIQSTGDDWERQKNKLAKAAANWLINELFKHLKAEGANIKEIKITPENFAEFIALVYQDKVNSSAAQTILNQMYKTGGDPTHIMSDLKLEQIDDKKALEKTIEEVMTANPDQVEQYKKGKTNVLQFFVGQIMSATKGKANPKVVIEILKEKL
jgi:aspartyl-tRNA(Asn)/glutamyl-tRNA(Gln) amidotransferase subunit B